MRTIQKRQSHIGRLIVPAITVSFLAYFAIHAQSGRYSLEAKAALSRELAERGAKIDEVTEVRERLEQRVQLLHDGTLERDMIDERARRALNVTTDDEIVILR
ncbi:septum formation initiator family protein [Aurantimonas sp. C2-6-R+9]|uniref:Septum formation initiator family protein n=2 Tax=root TaxID=1 RepID=A0A9C9NC53_9HYPH|nr:MULTISPECIES: septum formation initiator family protein [unclassified Aurantimonas]MEC5290293.1 septum formation initiator family protein [Aurantimonas sp. C2-3-R2]MEC5321644.1 septum formation initiator family protein [Aurantimonas sp. A3-2-R12]MEC5380403.1 septum formation initiator family protein [Aurantimonas sp. C2-6-R+9]MEC5411357.1 septum formation initiator family protein [Aurantimonas sp. C2-4-R8]HDZ71321.1 septum formation initiator family protein [Aurantimonas coralicida]